MGDEAMIEVRIGRAGAGVPGFLFENPQSLAEVLAGKLAAQIRDAAKVQRQFLLGCPSGRTPLGTYQTLAGIVAESEMDVSHLVIVMMDEYVEHVDGEFRYCPKRVHYSCHAFAEAHIVGAINQTLPEKKRIQKSNVWFPAPGMPEMYDARIRDAGGVDLFIMVPGQTDLHVAFNSRGSAHDSASRVVPLALETRVDNMGTFPGFQDLSEVPEYGVTVGLKAITQYSKEVVMIVHGGHKRQAVRIINERCGFEKDYPASIIYQSSNASVWLDKLAAGDIEVEP